MKQIKTLMQRGKFKQEIHKALYKSKDIKELLLGDISELPANVVLEKFKEHVKSHLFIEDTITKADTYIYYDIVFPRLSEHIKSCAVIMYLICERSTIDGYSKDGFVGNKIDILSQMVENALINDEEVVNKFGIGRLRIENVDIYNATRFYGVAIRFEVPAFR